MKTNFVNIGDESIFSRKFTSNTHLVANLRQKLVFITDLCMSEFYNEVYFCYKIAMNLMIKYKFISKFMMNLHYFIAEFDDDLLPTENFSS